MPNSSKIDGLAIASSNNTFNVYLLSLQQVVLPDLSPAGEYEPDTGRLLAPRSRFSMDVRTLLTSRVHLLLFVAVLKASVTAADCQ